MDYILSFAYAIAESKVSRKIKLLLNVVFVGSIASYIFKVFYFDYKLLDLTNYQLIYDFVINGEFIIPFSIFYLTWQITQFLGDLLFKVPNMLISQDLKSRIRKYSIEKTFPEELLNQEQKEVVKKFVAVPKEFSIKKLIQSLSNAVTPSNFAKLQLRANIAQANIESEFILITRALLALLIYFGNISHFGWFLFVTLIVTMLMTAFLQAVAYQFAEIIPFVFSTFKEEAVQSNSDQAK